MKYTLLLAVLALLAAGCGLAAADTQATVIAQVNATVAAMPPKEVLVTQQVVVTQEVIVTQEVPVTVVVEVTPTEGGPGTQDTPAPEATHPPTTSTTGQDPLAGANATPIIDDHFDFPDKYFWWTFGPGTPNDSSSGEGRVENETFMMTSNQVENYEWTFDGKKLQNFYVSGLTEVAGQQCKAGDHWGLIFRYKDNANFYMFGVSCDGKYSLMKRTVDGFEIVLPPTESTSIKRLGQPNVLGVRAVGDQLSLYANDQFLITVTDGTFPEGLIGMYIRTLLTPNMSVMFDDITAYVVTQ